MKQVKRFGFATALLCVTALLITAFIVLFSQVGCSPNDKSKENSPDKISMVSDPAVELKAGMHKLWEDYPEKFIIAGTNTALK